MIMKTIILMTLFSTYAIIGFSQKLQGLWQIGTPDLSDAYLGNYTFSDSTFMYNINGYDGLNPIRSLGGTYIIKSDTIYFTVKYIKKIIGGQLCRSHIYTSNDSWEMYSDTIHTEKLVPPICATSFIKFLKTKDNDVLLLDGRQYYKIKEDGNN